MAPEQNLDGKTPVKPVPFDAHDRRVRDVEPPAEPQEYPKAVDHVKHPSGVGHEPVLVNNEDEEAAHLENKAEDQN